MTDPLFTRLSRPLLGAWLGAAFIIGLLPIALADRMRRRTDFIGPDHGATTYWIGRDSDRLDIRSSGSMIIALAGRSTARNYLTATQSRSRVRAYMGAFCLVMLRPLRYLGRARDEQYLDPSIYPMY